MDSTEAWIELSFRSRHQLSHLRHADAEALDVPSLQDATSRIWAGCEMPASEYDWQVVANLLAEGWTRGGLALVVSAGQGREGTELEVLHTTREAQGTMVVTARPVRLEQGVTYCGLVTFWGSGVLEQREGIHIPSLCSSPGKTHPLPPNEGPVSNCKTVEAELKANRQTGSPLRGARPNLVPWTTNFQ